MGFQVAVRMARLALVILANVRMLGTRYAQLVIIVALPVILATLMPKVSGNAKVVAPAEVQEVPALHCPQ